MRDGGMVDVDSSLLLLLVVRALLTGGDGFL